MTDKQSTAYEVPFVELLESVPNNSRLWVDFPEGMGSTHFPVGHYCHKAAAELRRLHEVNAELVEALRTALSDDQPYISSSKEAVEALRARLAQPENDFNPDWDAMAVMVEEQQRMAKRIEELEARLAQPEPEPVAWVERDFWNHLETFNCGTAYRIEDDDREPLYTAPPQREHDKESDAVDTLTEEGWTWDGDQWQRPAQEQPEPEQEQSYKDKSCIEDDGCPTEKAVLQRFWRKHQQSEPEPVAWRFDYAKYRENDLRGRQWTFNVFSQTKPYMNEMVQDVTPLYTAPPQREWQGLTDEEMLTAAWQAGFDIHEDYDNEDDDMAYHWWTEDGEQCDEILFKLRDLMSAKLKKKNS